MFHKTIQEVLDITSSNSDQGLSTASVQERQMRDGKNELSQQKKPNFFKKIVSQFKDFMIYTLYLVSIISLAMGEWQDAILILLIIFVNALIGAIQELNAEKSVNAIRKLSSPHTTVIRNGIQAVVATSDLVIGDIVLLKAGDIVGADLRLIETNRLRINESHLTGESKPVSKDSDIIEKDNPLISEKSNLAFMGTIVTNGIGKGVVVAIAKDAEIGKISKMMNEVKNEQTPLQKEINSLGKRLIIITSCLIALIFILNIILHFAVDHTNGQKEIIDMFKVAFLSSVALGVAAIPEGLPAIVSIILSIGMKKLAKERAIVKNLLSVETLGAVNIICTDKTGTLTENKMELKSIITNESLTNNINDNPISQQTNDALIYAILTSDSTLNIKEDGTIEKVGDPVELSFLDYIYKTNSNYKDELDTYNKILQIPFSSETKRMETVVEKDGKHILIVKGAPDFLIPLLKNKKLAEQLTNKNEELSNQSLRSILVISKKINKSFTEEQLTSETDFDFIGLFSMYDPPKLSVKETIQTAHEAGIRTMVLTGDNVNTARAIATEVGVINDDSLAINATELRDLNDEEFKNVVLTKQVYARVSPEDKLRIIKTLKNEGFVTAMTGDGVNDGPALKTADIGIAMGKGGTEVAKDASDLILTDDNYQTIITAVSEGRSFYENIKRAISFLLSSNLGEIIAILLLILSMTFVVHKTITPFSPIQLLWINLVTDSIMALAIGFNKKDKGVMNQPPRTRKESFLGKSNWVNILFMGFVIGAMTAISYGIGYKFSPNAGLESRQNFGQTMAFLTITLAELFHCFNAKSGKKSIFEDKVNWYIVFAFAISFGLQLLVLLITPIAKFFELTTLTPTAWMLCFAISLPIITISEVYKLILRAIDRKKRIITK